MFLDGGRKPENPDRTHAYMERTCKLHTERPSWEMNLEPGTLSLWGDGANHHATVQPSSDTVRLNYVLKDYVLCQTMSFFNVIYVVLLHKPNFSLISHVAWPNKNDDESRKKNKKKKTKDQKETNIKALNQMEWTHCVQSESSLQIHICLLRYLLVQVTLHHTQCCTCHTLLELVVSSVHKD